MLCTSTFACETFIWCRRPSQEVRHASWWDWCRGQAMMLKLMCSSLWTRVARWSLPCLACVGSVLVNCTNLALIIQVEKVLKTKRKHMSMCKFNGLIHCNWEMVKYFVQLHMSYLRLQVIWVWICWTYCASYALMQNFECMFESINFEEPLLAKVYFGKIQRWKIREFKFKSYCPNFIPLLRVWEESKERG